MVYLHNKTLLFYKETNTFLEDKISRFYPWLDIYIKKQNVANMSKLPNCAITTLGKCLKQLNRLFFKYATQIFVNDYHPIQST
jgi:hypothetical protein